MENSKSSKAGSAKKHKKHKKEKYEEKSYSGDRPPGLKLILKVGNSSTPEHSDSPGPILQQTSYTVTGDEESLQSSSSFYKKSKKKKKKKDRDHDKYDKKKKHHHKDKRKKAYEDQSSQDGVSVGEESLAEPPVNERDQPPPKEDSSYSSEPLGKLGSREPRLCVQLLRQKQNKNPLFRAIEYLQRQLEKRDPQQFFAWPVTDQIAPGYSKTISHPMDFSTMRQKLEDNAYPTLTDYINDFKLMCNNAMTYNQPDTIYYKSAKRLLHGGLKLFTPEKLRQLSNSLPFINQIPADQLGFQLGPGPTPMPSENRSASDNDEAPQPVPVEISPKRKASTMPESVFIYLFSFSIKILRVFIYLFMFRTKFEAVPDDLTSEQILDKAQKSASATAEKLSLKKPKTNMGFLRQQQDGSTSLAIFVPGEGVDPERPKQKAVSLGQLIGKLSHGSGQLQGFREDRRNIAKTVKPLNYGAFGSYAPSYDSTFANLTKEESDLIYETYGDENATLYAESILNFAKDCDYTLTMVDNLLDLLTGGEHRKSKTVIDEQRKFREEEEKVRELMECNATSPSQNQISNMKIDLTNIKADIEQLKSLSDLGIDTTFLSYYDYSDGIQRSVVQDKLEHTSELLEKLQQVQNDRLSAPLPNHLSHITQPSETELNLAEKITESLTELAKQVPPGAIIPVPAIRKAMGIVNETMTVSTSTSTTSPIQNSVEDVVVLDGGESSGEEENCVGVGQLDLESELREFLESDTALSNFPLHDDKTIEEMLSES
ncbi:bromodomain-containing protein 7 isoform X2 [Cimex lectularius]|uniref:Bromo domain-containing protein n=1 Tax=Cimex lectularius TaxID=79782 RepID=A0A8I6SUG4_CIMLE|nr:bromodomain-containing protein 7 isoform X2 [Cimex lectularius]